jgi:hypothetical protein
MKPIEIILILAVILVILFMAVGGRRKTMPTPVEPTESLTENHGRVKFNDMRHERHFNKETGSVILEQFGQT